MKQENINLGNNLIIDASSCSSADSTTKKFTYPSDNIKIDNDKLKELKSKIQSRKLSCDESLVDYASIYNLIFMNDSAPLADSENTTLSNSTDNLSNKKVITALYQ